MTEPQRDRCPAGADEVLFSGMAVGDSVSFDTFEKQAADRSARILPAMLKNS